AAGLIGGSRKQRVRWSSDTISTVIWCQRRHTDQCCAQVRLVPLFLERTTVRKRRGSVAQSSTSFAICAEAGHLILIIDVRRIASRFSNNPKDHLRSTARVEFKAGADDQEITHDGLANRGIESQITIRDELSGPP
ncbi:MAG: hypothetical protein ACR2PG_10760, partial [Hyphomicrobiaceae bacterium]